MKSKNQMMKTLNTLNFKKGSFRNTRRNPILLVTIIMFLISTTAMLAETNNAPTKTRNGGFYMDSNKASQSIEITIFRGRMLAEPNLLVWQTIKEKKNKGFEIERSNDGINWDSIGFVEGNGSTKETHNYEFSDEKPIKGINYYRLKQIDLNGEYEYSEIVVLERENNSTEGILAQNQ